MAIQVRRGLKKDFDPYKMLPGEWAVSIDAATSNQIVWMCFAGGLVKRMGTYEDFYAQIEEATEEIKNYYLTALGEAKDQLQNDLESYIQGKVDDEWIPELEALVQRAENAAVAAETSEKNAKASENKSKEYQKSAEENATTAAQKATEAGNSAEVTAKSAEAAAESAGTATAKAKEASDWSDLSESFAHGGTGLRENEDADNSEYYYQQTKRISQGINGIVNMGNTTFAELATVEKEVNYMYNVIDAFVSDETFNDGGGMYYGPGNNVVWTRDGLWDVTASSAVTGIRGKKENSFSQGNYVITPEKVGALPEEGTAADSVKWNGLKASFISEEEFQKIQSPDSNTVYFRYKEKQNADL